MDVVFQNSDHNFNKDTWLADSGASSHMVNTDKGKFVLQKSMRL